MKAFFEVHLRLVITVWTILISVLSLLYLMNFMKFDSLMSDVVSSKLDVISSSLETSILKADRLGIPLKSANNVSDLMDKAKQRDQNVSSIDVIDLKGNVIFSTNRASGLPFPDSEVVRRALKSNDKNWNLSVDLYLYSGMRLFDGFDNLIGSVVITYDKASFYGVYSFVQLHLLEMTVFIFLFFALIVLLIIQFGFGDVTNIIKLIQVHSDGREETTPLVVKGSISSVFADQIEQSKKMKIKVVQELESVQGLADDSSATKGSKQ
ncbi:hypothetical protein [Marinomonas algicola]|jgi:hypothetical protein|uniref:hypothetical protein n=1 Tax=Marinomonas algicola TaxID=2773454 RepID=UPI00174CCFF0|nr:hypothetical protein [Marinomonas algicola]